MPVALRGHCLWLLPDEPHMARFRSLMDTLRDAPDSPRFLPHITLLGQTSLPREQLTVICHDLVRDIPPLTLQTRGCFSGEDYYCALFLGITPTPQLLRARRLAAIACHHLIDKTYAPHLSLRYGAPCTRKACANPALQHEQTFTCSRLALVATPGKPDAWEIVSALALCGAGPTC